jgi:hypothetical protein
MKPRIAVVDDGGGEKEKDEEMKGFVGEDWFRFMPSL